MFYYVFHNTSDVFAAEEILLGNDIVCEITPTPVRDIAYCGVCIKTTKSSDNLLTGLDYLRLEE